MPADHGSSLWMYMNSGTGSRMLLCVLTTSCSLDLEDVGSTTQGSIHRDREPRKLPRALGLHLVQEVKGPAVRATALDRSFAFVICYSSPLRSLYAQFTLTATLQDGKEATDHPATRLRMIAQVSQHSMQSARIQLWLIHKEQNQQAG